MLTLYRTGTGIIVSNIMVNQKQAWARLRSTLVLLKFWMPSGKSRYFIYYILFEVRSSTNMRLCRRWPLVEDMLRGNLRWKTTFGWRQPLMEDDLRWWLIPLTVTAQLSPNQNCYQVSQPQTEFAIVENAELCMQTCAENKTFLRHRWLNHYNIGVGGGEG